MLTRYIGRGKARREGQTNSFTIFIIGYVIFTGGVAYAAYRLHAPTVWIVTGAVILLGFGIITGVPRTRHRVPS